MLLEPTRTPQTSHSSAIVFSTDVTLRAVFRNDVGETGGHDEDGQAGGGAPVVVDAVGGVIGVGGKVDEATFFGPHAGHAVASLIRAEGSVRRRNHVNALAFNEVGTG